MLILRGGVEVYRYIYTRFLLGTYRSCFTDNRDAHSRYHFFLEKGRGVVSSLFVSNVQDFYPCQATCLVGDGLCLFQDYEKRNR